MSAQTERKVTDAAVARLVGRRVVRVGYMPAAEAADLGWSHRPAVLEFDDGTIAYAACDEEGNDAGVLFVETRRDDLCLGRFPI
jgi:hypothetical protein